MPLLADLPRPMIDVPLNMKSTHHVIYAVQQISARTSPRDVVRKLTLQRRIVLATLTLATKKIIDTSSSLLRI
jgi:hypothetical protein